MATITGAEVLNANQVKLTVSGVAVGANYRVTVSNVQDAAGNTMTVPASKDVTLCSNRDIIAFPYDYTFGSLIELYICGIPSNEEYPIAVLKIDDVPVATFEDVRGSVVERVFRYSRWYYVHYEPVTIDRIKVEYTNDILGGPNIECLNEWALDPGSTAEASYHFDTPDQYARVTLTAPSGGDPSELNALIHDTHIANADRVTSVTASMRAPVGMQGRLEFWTTSPSVALVDAENVDGTGDWIDIAFDPITLTGELQYGTQVRLITNSPDALGTYVDWKDVYVKQELITNPDFSPTIDPWYVVDGSNITTEVRSDEMEGYVRGTLTGTPQENFVHYNSIIQDVGEVGAGIRVEMTISIRAPVGTTARVALFGLPWGDGLISSTRDFAGTGEWEDIEVQDPGHPEVSGIDPLITTEDQQEIQLRLILLTPNTQGTYIDWKNVSITKSLVKNSTFSDRSLYVDKVLVDGYSYETESDDVYSTGTWTAGDGATPSAGYKESEVLTNNGYFDYAAVDDAALYADVDTRIDLYRKGNCTVTVLAGGLPVPGATVSVQQTNHSFLFGSNFFYWPAKEYRPADPMSVYAGASDHPLTAAEEEFYETYRRRFKEIFNYATLPFYWVSHEPIKDQTPDTFKAEWADWCIANNIIPKGHTLFYPIDEPDWLAAEPDVKARTLLEVSRTMTAQSGHIGYWDIFNESSSQYFSPALINYAPALIAMFWEEGQLPFLNEVAALARTTSPADTLIINDYDVSDAYYAMLSGIDPANYDIIGIQSHMHEEVWSNQKIWHVANRFGALKPVHLTELSILSGPPYSAPGVRLTDFYGQSIYSWATTTAGEIRQAAEVERFYKMAFSNPNIGAITWWDLTDYGSWMGAPRGLLRTDMTRKPAFNVLHDLVKSEWWTTTSGTTNGSGEFTFRGFAGTYTVTVTAPQGVATQSETLSTGGSSWAVSF